MVTADSVKSKIQRLINKANEINGNADTDLTSSVNRLIDGYGKGGGEQPTLFAPIVTAGLNEMSWKNDTNNGGFPVDISADVGGETVTSPLSITEDMDGKTLTITASADKFKSASAQTAISYVSGGRSVLTIDTTAADLSSKTWLVFMADTTAIPDKAFCGMNGEKNKMGGAYINMALLPSSGTLTSDLAITFTQDASCKITIMGKNQESTVQTGFVLRGSNFVFNGTGDSFKNLFEGAVSVYDNGTDSIVATAPIYVQSWKNGSTHLTFDGLAGHTYSLMVEIAAKAL